MPCLLLSDGALVKTIRFGRRLYIGDPVNTINIFNRLEVDELVLLDIDATPKRHPPDFDLVAEVASECSAPLSYGGGIRSVEDAQRVLSIGAEKIVINSHAAEDPTLITRIAERFGSQAVIASIDAKRALLGGYRVCVEGGRRALHIEPALYAQQAAAAGAGEILLTSIDRDGTMQGYDIALISLVTAAVRVPVIACGGAGRRSHLADPIKQGGASAVAAGSIFVFQGPERGVLINFPSRAQLEELLS